VFVGIRTNGGLSLLRGPVDYAMERNDGLVSVLKDNIRCGRTARLLALRQRTGTLVGMN